jgi:hypothetical protein
MQNIWTKDEINASCRAYLWMLRSLNDGHVPIKKRVHEALVDGPLRKRSLKSVEYRFQNISSVLRDQGEEWINGYAPAKHVGTQTAEAIAQAIANYRSRSRSDKRVSFLINAIPSSTIKEATQRLRDGEVFTYPKSSSYDVVVEGKKLPPKRVIGFAGLLHYGAPLMPVDFSGGEDTPAFKALAKADLTAQPRIDPESPSFRKTVNRLRRSRSLSRPNGKKSPSQSVSKAVSYERDPKVVAWVEKRAAGCCELCGEDAPFKRKDGSAFLEVHHIVPLGKKGEDTVFNAAALCPNCHRECHHGIRASEITVELKRVVARAEAR